MDANQQKINWLIRLQNLYISRNVKEIGDDLHEKLDLLIYLHELLGENNVTLKDNEIFLESLVVKFYLHGLTIEKIVQGYEIESKFLDKEKISNFTFLDVSSLLTVGRAQMESLLMFQHIYVNSSDESEQKLRYYAWIYTALVQRLDFPRSDNFDQKKLEATKIDIEDFRKRIINCKAYQNLTAKQQKSLIERGNGKLFKTWDQIFKDCKFSKNGILEKFYYILSSYAHSEGLSGMQLKHNKYFLNGANNQQWIYLQIMTSWLMTSLMIENLVNRFKPINDAYLKLDEKIRYEVYFLNQIIKKDEPIA